MTHHSVMTSSLRIKILKIDNFGLFSSDIDFKSKMDIFRDDISLIINQCHLQATEGSLRRTLYVRQPRSASKRSALVINNILDCLGVFSIYSKYPKLLWLPRPKWLKPEMTRHIPRATKGLCKSPMD